MRFALLGEVTAHGPAGAVDLGHRRQRSVLAALLDDAVGPVTADQLLDRVWGGRPPSSARGTLFSYIARLRRAIAPVRIERIRGGYLVAVEPAAVDTARFGELIGRAQAATDDGSAARFYREALALWRGEPFPGMDTPWANDRRQLLARQRFLAQLDHGDLQLRLGRHDELLTDLPGRADEHPLDERLAGQLVLALHRSGRAADASAHYQEFHRRLVREVGIEPGAELRRLHRDVLSERDGVEPASVRPRPRQLPPPPQAFRGRSATLQRLTALLTRPGRAPVVTLCGGGGIGKTALALHWAHANLDRFPDGQLFAHLRGFDTREGPRDPAAVLRGLLLSLGVNHADLPRDRDARSGLFRTLVAGQRLLLVLDDAADTAQVEPLLPGSSSVTTLVTSRRPLTAMVASQAAETVALDPLDAGESGTLLSARLGAARLSAEPAATRTLITFCAGLPLALAITAARAQVETSLSLSALAEQLRDDRTRLDVIDTGEPQMSLRAVLAASHRGFSEQAAATAALIALAPGPDISATAVQAMVGRAVAADVRELLAVHILEESRPGRYHMHDLVRLHAVEEADALPAGHSVAALRRLIGFQVATGRAADRLLDPTRPAYGISDPSAPKADLRDKTDAAAWFADEHDALVAAQHLAARRGWHAQTWELAMVLDTWHWRQGLADDHTTMLSAAIDAAGVADAKDVQCRLHRSLAQVLGRGERLSDAATHLRRSIELAEQTGLVLERAHCHTVLAQVWAMRGDHLLASRDASRAVVLFRRAGQPRFEAQALNQLGYGAAQLGEFDEAREHCTRALALQRAAGEVDGEILDSLGYIEEQAERLADAVSWYQAAIDRFRELGHEYNLTTALIGLGRTQVARGRTDQGSIAWQEALTLCRMQGRTMEADTLQQQLGELAEPVGGGPLISRETGRRDGDTAGRR